jgi:hypothetical protein
MKYQHEIPVNGASNCYLGFGEASWDGKTPVVKLGWYDKQGTGPGLAARSGWRRCCRPSPRQRAWATSPRSRACRPLSTGCREQTEEGCGHMVSLLPRSVRRMAL